MCYPDDARPPDHGLGGVVAGSEELVLSAADGTRLSAYAAHPAAPSGKGIVIVPDVRGLHNFYKALACRFAEAGVEAVAIDFLGRTAGLGDRGDSFEYQAHVPQVTSAGMALDVAAGIARLRSTGAGDIFTVGFCFGGSASWNQSAAQPGLRGAIGFYGRPERCRPFIDDMKAPLLLLIAGADTTPREDFLKFDEELTEAAVEHSMVIFDGAPHSFFDRSFEHWRDACLQSWREVLGFMGVAA